MIWFSASRFVGWAASAHQRARETDDVGTECPPYLTPYLEYARANIFLLGSDRALLHTQVVFNKYARLIEALKRRGVSDEMIAEAERDLVQCLAIRSVGSLCPPKG